ncbi:OFA family MFS transporter [Pendulispora albinea]|uniref:OFA family MFS transporter n=1 Tax=Pendulispora albinea TaxID=2741071 RepID=A0ABZ2M807_9BACT
MSGLLDRERSMATAGYSRWLIPPAALAIHLSIGQVYAFSVFKRPLQAHFATSPTPIACIFSLAIVILGLSAAFGGTWVERQGPRKAMFVAACCWGTGFAIGALGIATRQLWLLYLGYGVVGGIGLGIAYISPVPTLIKWFPDRPGLATGMAIMGFGGGALIASPVSLKLMQAFETSEGNPGSGVMKTFLVLGACYFAAMMFGAFTVRLPPPGWAPPGAASAPSNAPGTSGAPSGGAGEVSRRVRMSRPSFPGFDPDRQVRISAANAIRTPQFWMLWVTLFCNVTAGIGILEQAAPMIQDFFRDGPRSHVSAVVAGGFVGVLSICNMAGRFVWSSTSDIVGRKRIYSLYLGLGVILYALLAMVGGHSTVVFVLLAGAILSLYGGGFATIPAYIRDLYGPFQVGAIHGRLLTAWSAAGVAGPLIINAILQREGKPGALTAEAYRPAFLVMASVLAVGFVANWLVRAVDERFDEASRSPVPPHAPSEGEVSHES